MPVKHTVTVGPSAAVIVDADGRARELPKSRVSTYRARCRCGWRSAERATAAQAEVEGKTHLRLAEKEN